MTKCLNTVDSKTENLRISFMDMHFRKQTNPQYSNRIHKFEVEGLYQQKNIYKISLNDQLENFYNRCKSNRFVKHEVAYFFHAELLSDEELQKYQTKFYESVMCQYESKIIFRRVKESFILEQNKPRGI